MADRGAGGVVAGHGEEDEERRDLVRGEHVLAEVVVDERGGEVVGRVRRGAPRPARSSASVSCMPASKMRGDRIVASPMNSGSPAPRITLVASSTVSNSLRGMPIMSQITSSGNGCESTSTRSTSPFSQKPSITSVQIVSTESSTPCELPGGERPGHDAALAGVAGVVHVDERPEELERLGGHVGDRHRALARAEVLRAAADLDDLGVAGHRVEASRSAPVIGFSNSTRHERALLAELRELRPCARRAAAARTTAEPTATRSAHS